MADWSALREASRVNVVGTSGSGKSTFARRLATLRNLPYVEMDQLYWKADWEEPDRRDYHARIETVVAEPEWVLDGNYRRTCPIKWPRTEVMVFLDLPLLLTVQRLIRRSWQRGTSGQELWPGTGNRETLRRSFFSSDSVIWWASSTMHAIVAVTTGRPCWPPIHTCTSCTCRAPVTSPIVWPRSRQTSRYCEHCCRHAKPGMGHNSGRED